MTDIRGLTTAESVTMTDIRELTTAEIEAVAGAVVSTTAGDPTINRLLGKKGILPIGGFGVENISPWLSSDLVNPTDM
jgi:hypothetical protein